MRAAVLHARHDVRVESVPDAPSPGPHELRMRVLACGLCGTDAHEFDHAPVFAPLTHPHPGSLHVGAMVIGHEFLGVVDAVGSGATAFAPGQRVVAGAGVWCGECDACRAGRTNLCVSYHTFGLNRDGGMAEFVTVPAAMCVEVPAGTDDLDAVLSQPVAVAMHAVRRSGVRAGDAVAVLGAGAIGSLIVACLADAGVAATVFDIDDGRLSTGRALGAGTTVRIDPGRDLPPEHLAAFAIAFDTTGVPSGVGDCLRMVRRGGRVMMVGLPAAAVPIDTHDAVVREIDFVTSSAHVCREDLPAAVELLARRSISREIVERVVALDDIVTEGLIPMSRREVVGKVVVRVAADALPEGKELR